jgi:hypothetical protein
MALFSLLGPGPIAAEPLARIPFFVQDHRIVIEMKAGDSPAMKVLLDTGLTFDGVYLFQEKWIESLGLQDLVERNVSGAGEGDPTSSVKSDGATLSAAGFEFHDQTIYVSRSPRTQRFPRDGVAGWSLFGHHVVEIDHETGTLLLHDPATFEPDTSWKAIDIELRKRIPWLEVGIDVDGEQEIPASVYIDLGAGDALLVLVRADMKLTVPKETERRLIGVGLSGEIHGEFGTVSRVTIAGFELHDVLTAFPRAEARSRQEGADGIVGSDLLRRFHVVFDYSRLKLYLKPNREFGTPFD